MVYSASGDTTLLPSDQFIAEAIGIEKLRSLGQKFFHGNIEKKISEIGVKNDIFPFYFRKVLVSHLSYQLIHGFDVILLVEYLTNMSPRAIFCSALPPWIWQVEHEKWSQSRQEKKCCLLPEAVIEFCFTYLPPQAEVSEEMTQHDVPYLSVVSR